MVDGFTIAAGTLCWFVAGNGIGGVSMSPVRVHTRHKPSNYVLVETYGKGRRERVWSVWADKLHLTWGEATEAARAVSVSDVEVAHGWTPAPDCDHCEEERQRAEGLRKAVLAACGVQLHEVEAIRASGGSDAP